MVRRAKHSNLSNMKNRRWDILGNFEYKHKKQFLKKLTFKECTKIFTNLYHFFQKIIPKKDYQKINLRKIQTLSKVHSMFMKVKQ